MKRWLPVLVVIVLLAVPVAVAQSPIDNVVELPPNEPVTVRCQGGDELIATIWGPGEWVLVCREYVLAEKGVAAEQ